MNKNNRRSQQRGYPARGGRLRFAFSSALLAGIVTFILSTHATQSPPDEEHVKTAAIAGAPATARRAPEPTHNVAWTEPAAARHEAPAAPAAQVEDGRNPRDVKFELAGEIVARFHDARAAAAARADFIERFRNHALPGDVEVREVVIERNSVPLPVLMRMSSLTASSSEAQRMIRQGAVRIDGARVESVDLEIEVGSEHVYQIGRRRFQRIRVISS